MKRISVGVDLEPDGSGPTPCTGDAIALARWIALQSGAAVSLIHSLAPDERWWSERGGYVRLARRPFAVVLAALTDLKSEFEAAGVSAEIEFSDDTAWIAIVRHALTHEVDLVVLGKRSNENGDGRRFGSVARKVLRKAPCAVWLVKPDSTPLPRTILACTDLGTVGDRVLQLASSVASASEADLHVVHAYDLPIDIQMQGGEEQLEHQAKSRSEAADRLRKLLAESDSPEAELHIGLTSPTRAIQECVDRLHPDLVVMGSISRGGLAGVLVGNTAERVFDHLDCSLLVVKPEDFVCPLPVE